MILPRLLLLIIFILTFTYSRGQIAGVGLNDSQRAKLEKVKSAERRIELYKKYIHSDSVRYLKQINHYYRRKSKVLTDTIVGSRRSIERSKAKLEKAVGGTAQSIRERLDVDLFPGTMHWDIEKGDTALQLKGIYSSIRQSRTEITDSILSFSPDLRPQSELNIPAVNASKIPPIHTRLLSRLRSKFPRPYRPEIPGRLTKRTSFIKGELSTNQQKYSEYMQYAEMSPDSLRQMATMKGEKEIEQYVAKRASMGQHRDELAKVEPMKSFGSEYSQYTIAVADSATRLEILKQKVQEKAMSVLENNPRILKSAQSKVSSLARKYSFIPSSQDLSTAVKRTSLKGRSFRERLVFASNFQVSSINPVAIDFSPQLGYRPNARITVGSGFNYRQSFADSLPYIAPDVWGYKLFGSYDIKAGFFAYTEYGLNSTRINVPDEGSRRVWHSALFVGGGRKFMVHKSIDMTVVALYNLTNKPGDPVYPRPFVVRFGFQLSELALLKKRPEIKY